MKHRIIKNKHDKCIVSLFKLIKKEIKMILFLAQQYKTNLCSVFFFMRTKRLILASHNKQYKIIIIKNIKMIVLSSIRIIIGKQLFR